VALPERQRGPRVALVSSSYSPAIGGVETHVRSVARLLLQRGYAVEVWTVAQDGDFRSAVVDGLRVRYLPSPLPARSAHAATAFGASVGAAWRRWKQAQRDFMPDLLHVHCFGPNGVYSLAASMATRTPLIVTSHGETLGDDDAVYARSALLRASLRMAIRRAAAVTAPSDYVLRDLRERFGLHRGVVITNGIENSIVVAAPTAQRRHFVAVGRLGTMKGFDLLIQAFGRARLDSEVSLMIAGDGPERRRLEALVDHHSLRARVRFRGWLDPEAVAQMMASAMSVVVPSRSEAFGIVALEAWRAGAPLIMTSRGGGPEFVDDRVDGLLVDPLEVDQLAHALEDVSQDVMLREALAAAGRLRVEAFDWSRVVDEYEHLYDRLRRS
jgi:glycogen(starch) synthase